ncbi:Gfo/Idh/MocA family protein [Actinocrispum wychmicini]|uniref:Putative dehydrogenase n=1 Tax=Actinocrispum wychmicini TaxID=1213861 RepID=A0A4R2K6Q8_9PSEU|nr:Gfo/Idh/MocA family oxidoreductase [Actinocrispum wychmicini]TCO62035.1 putative dehydrogenase [Actinocrispum wychmicini]
MTRIVLFGHGWWAQKYLVPGLRSVPGADLVALCGRDTGRAQAAAANLGVGRTFTDIHAMLEATEPDGLLIVSPPSSHVDAVRAAGAQGVPVFCEKPLGRNGTETAEMVTACANVPTIVGFTQRWHPGVRLAARLTDELGRLRHLRYTSASCIAANAQAAWDWRSDSQQYAYGVLSDLGPHAVDIAEWLGGEITDVTATAHTVFPDRPDGRNGRRAVDNWDDCVVSARTADDVAVSLALTRVLPPSPYRRFQHRLELVGDSGTLTYDSDRPAEVVLTTGGAAPRVVRADGPDLNGTTPGSFQEFMAVSDHAAAREAADILAVFGGQKPTAAPTVADGHRGQVVLDAAAASARTRTWTHLKKASSP